MDNNMTILSTIIAQAVAQAIEPLNVRIQALESSQSKPVAQAQDPMSALLTALVTQAQPVQTQPQRKPSKAADLNVTWSNAKNCVEYQHENAKHFWTTSERKAVNAYIKAAGGKWEKTVNGKGGRWVMPTTKAATEFIAKAPKCILAAEVEAQQKKAAEYYANK